VDGSQEVSGKFVVASCDAPEILEPAETALDKNASFVGAFDTADNASIVFARRACLVRWQMRLYLSPLLVVEPEQSFADRSSPCRINSVRGNQNR
jgi:hypothetical protein